MVFQGSQVLPMSFFGEDGVGHETAFLFTEKHGLMAVSHVRAHHPSVAIKQPSCLCIRVKMTTHQRLGQYQCGPIIQMVSPQMQTMHAIAFVF